MLNFRDIKWHSDVPADSEEDEEFKDVVGHYKVMAHIIQEYEYGRDRMKKNCPVQRSEEDILKRLFVYKQLVEGIQMDKRLFDAYMELIIMGQKKRDITIIELFHL